MITSDEKGIQRNNLRGDDEEALEGAAVHSGLYRPSREHQNNVVLPSVKPSFAVSC